MSVRPALCLPADPARPGAGGTGDGRGGAAVQRAGAVPDQRLADLGCLQLSGRVPGQQPDQPPLRPGPGARGVDRLRGGGVVVDLVATPRIAIASCSAFIVAQLLDITVFDRLRRGSWWRAPMVATTCSATVDTTIFWSIAFAGSALPWVSWAAGDLAVKLAIGVCLLAPFRARCGRWRRCAPPADRHVLVGANLGWHMSTVDADRWSARSIRGSSPLTDCADQRSAPTNSGSSPAIALMVHPLTRTATPPLCTPP